MSGFILLALVNGLLIGLSRSLNGQLSAHKGVFQASFYNHLFGFLLLSLLIMSLTMEPQAITLAWSNDKAYLYLGGIIGALYVALNSYVLNQIGATKAALFVISGQMATGLLLDYLFNQVTGDPFVYGIQALGVACIILGIVLSQQKKLPQKSSSEDINMPVKKHSSTA